MTQIVFPWIAVVLFMLAAVGSASEGRLVGALLFAIAGLAALPPLWRSIAKKGIAVPAWGRWTAAILALAIFGVTSPHSSASGGSSEPAQRAKSLASIESSKAQTWDDAGKWNVVSQKSKLDGSQNVVASVEADRLVNGRLSSVKRSLIIRCSEGKLTAHVDTEGQLTSQYASEGARRTSVGYRVGMESPQHLDAEESTDGRAFFIPRAHGLIDALRKTDTFVVEYAPFQSGIGIARFDVRGAPAALAKVVAACPG
ncbi:MAG TPA: hypothetical protein VIJ94_08240 [Caulobacteraceae bacterium]